MVLKVDKENEKISLGLKQTEPDPWTTIERRYPVGTRLKGKVRNLTNFGAFVEIEEGIDGLVHISDMSLDQARAASRARSSRRATWSMSSSWRSTRTRSASAWA